MKFLLDASALLPLVTRSGKQLIPEAAGAELITTDLAIYEACNGLWKLSVLLQSITLEDATEIAVILHELTARNLIKILGFASLDLSRTLVTAQKGKITFYDASYIEAARNMNATLVTEDQKLRKAACKQVKTISVLQFQRELVKNP